MSGRDSASRRTIAGDLAKCSRCERYSKSLADLLGLVRGGGAYDHLNPRFGRLVLLGERMTKRLRLASVSDRISAHMTR
jgi:hypothetical protein